MTKEEALNKILSFKSILPAASKEIDSIVEALIQETIDFSTAMKQNDKIIAVFPDNTNAEWENKVKHYQKQIAYYKEIYAKEAIEYLNNALELVNRKKIDSFSVRFNIQRALDYLKR